MVHIYVTQLRPTLGWWRLMMLLQPSVWMAAAIDLQDTVSRVWQLWHRGRGTSASQCDTGGGAGAGAGAQSSADPRGVNIGSPAAPRCRVVTGPRPTVTWEGWSAPRSVLASPSVSPWEALAWAWAGCWPRVDSLPASAAEPQPRSWPWARTSPWVSPAWEY